MTSKVLSALDVKDQVDFAILTVTQDEYDAILARFPDRSTVKGSQMLIPAILNGHSGHRDHRFRASRSLIGAKHDGK